MCDIPYLAIRFLCDWDRLARTSLSPTTVGFASCFFSLINHVYYCRERERERERERDGEMVLNPRKSGPVKANVEAKKVVRLKPD